MTVMRQNADGSWSPAESIGPIGPIAKLEGKLRALGFRRLARLLGRLDEVGL